MSDRENIAADMMETLDVATEPWGVKVQRVEVKDVRLPKNLQRAMAAEAEAAREAEAKVEFAPPLSFVLIYKNAKNLCEI